MKHGSVVRRSSIKKRFLTMELIHGHLLKVTFPLKVQARYGKTTYGTLEWKLPVVKHLILLAVTTPLLAMKSLLNVVSVCLTARCELSMRTSKTLMSGKSGQRLLTTTSMALSGKATTCYLLVKHFSILSSITTRTYKSVLA